jgi:hypothetical protein
MRPIRGVPKKVVGTNPATLGNVLNYLILEKNC